MQIEIEIETNFYVDFQTYFFTVDICSCCKDRNNYKYNVHVSYSKRFFVRCYDPHIFKNITFAMVWYDLGNSNPEGFLLAFS